MLVNGGQTYGVAQSEILMLGQAVAGSLLAPTKSLLRQNNSLFLEKSSLFRAVGNLVSYRHKNSDLHRQNRADYSQI